MSTTFFISCDPYGGYEYWIDNQTDSTLYVTYSDKYSDTVKVKEIKKHSKTLLIKFETVNGLYDYGNNFLKWRHDSLGIFKDSLLKKEISKDYLKRTSWTYEQKKTHPNSGDNIYKLTLTNKDVMPRLETKQHK
ncbi:MAG: hypothetical protein JSU07_04630 [Bacteroidetes bacterium]|nr:hypothetical protein [Bacteroidota bacterium]